MSGIPCHRCGCLLDEGSLKYQVEVRVRSCFDGVISEPKEQDAANELDRILSELSTYNEDEALRQVYEDDVFVVCSECKEAFLQEIYSHLRPEALPENGRAHLIN